MLEKTQSQWLTIKKIIAPTDVTQSISPIEWLETQTDEDFITSKGMIVIIHGKKKESEIEDHTYLFSLGVTLGVHWPKGAIWFMCENVRNVCVNVNKQQCFCYKNITLNLVYN